GGARAQQDETVRAQRDERRAAPAFAGFLCPLARETLLIAARARRARRVPRTEHAGRLLRRAEAGAEIHHGLCEVAGAALRRELTGERADARLAARQFVLDGEQARDHTLDI